MHYQGMLLYALLKSCQRAVFSWLKIYELLKLIKGNKEDTNMRIIMKTRKMNLYSMVNVPTMTKSSDYITNVDLFRKIEKT